jgi:hypothetical protein
MLLTYLAPPSLVRGWGEGKKRGKIGLSQIAIIIKGLRRLLFLPEFLKLITFMDKLRVEL